MTKSGTGTWDLGLEDSGTPGLWDSGTWDSGMRGCGMRGCETRGRRDVGCEDSGTGYAGLGKVGTRALGRTGLEDMINKQHLIFSLNLLGTILGALEKGIMCREFVSRLVADDLQLPWFNLICLPAYFTVKARAST